MNLQEAKALDTTHYQQLFDKSSDYYSSDRSEMLAFIPPTVKKTLEFGCGQGDFSALLKTQYDAEAWAVELHPQSAALAAEKLDRVLCMDAMESIDRLPDGYFDCILFFDLLEHLPDPFSLLDRCRDKLAPGGVLVASIPNIRYYRTFSKYVFSGEWEYRDQGILDIGHLRFFTVKSIRKLFGRLGYSLRELKGIHPTQSRTFLLLNCLCLNRLWDVRYKHFIAVAAKGDR